MKDYFGKRRPGARPARPADEPVIFPNGGQRPGWATATGLFETLGNRDLGAARQPLFPVDVESAPPLLMRSAPTAEVVAVRWHTRQGDEVTSGDLVALSVAGNPDARGRILGAADEGRVECVMGDYPRASGPRMRVEVDQILMLIRGGGDPLVCKDRECYSATPAMRVPETEEQEGGEEGGRAPDAVLD